MDALFPRECLCCHITIKNGVICENCSAGITLNSSLFCGKCKARIHGSFKICHKDFPYILGGAASYGDDKVKTLIHYLKFRGIRGAAEPLAEITYEYIHRLGIDLVGYSIIPIPLSKRRLRERGFNQSELIGKILAARLNMCIGTGVLARIKNTAPQSSTGSAIERRANVSGCFSAAKDSFLGKNIILIDDVTTSGATFFEAAIAAKSAGARNIISIAAAIA